MPKVMSVILKKNDVIIGVGSHEFKYTYKKRNGRPFCFGEFSHAMFSLDHAGEGIWKNDDYESFDIQITSDSGHSNTIKDVAIIPRPDRVFFYDRIVIIENCRFESL